MKSQTENFQKSIHPLFPKKRDGWIFVKENISLNDV